MNKILCVGIMFVMLVDYFYPLIRMEKTGKLDWKELLIRGSAFFSFLYLVPQIF